MWQNRVFIASGCLAAVLISYTAVRSVVGLSTSQKPTPMRTYEIPAFAALVECNAYFSHEILRIKNNLPAHNTTADLPTLHRYYRRLHRLLRQVGRRDGIAPATQTERLRDGVHQLNQQSSAAGSKPRDTNCRAMAEMPVARKRHSQRIVGR